MVAGILGATVVVAGTAIYFAVAQLAQQSLDGTLWAQELTVAGDLSSSDPLPDTNPEGQTVAVAFYRPNRDLRQSNGQPLPPATVENLGQRAIDSKKVILIHVRGADNVPRRVLVQPVDVGDGDVGALVLSRQLGELGRIHAQLLALIVTGGLVMTLGGAALAYWVAGRALRPVRELAARARDLSQHDLHNRVTIEAPPDELGDLVDTFNSMLDRLEGAFEALRAFSADASHELRGPLTLMRTQVEVALAGEGSAEGHRKVLAEMLDELEHLSRVTDHLLTLARGDGGAIRARKEPVDLVDLLVELGARWDGTAAHGRVRLSVQPPEAGTTLADPDLVRRILDNLVDNAIRHTPQGGEVIVSARSDGDRWRLWVKDEGPGVPADLRPRLFTRFARRDAARTRRSGGAGLGLAVSSLLARTQGGELSLVDEDGVGAVFELTLTAQPGSTDTDI